jgi:hypothetical protein
MGEERTKVFISYSHSDAEWLQRLQVHLRPLVRTSTIDLWADTKITPGSKWQDEIGRALAATKVAILLVSADFMASDYIAGRELPALLEASEKDGAIILLVIVSPSLFQEEPSLSQFQAVNDPKTPLVDLPKGKQEAVFVNVAQQIELAIGRPLLAAQVEAVAETLQDHQRTLTDQRHQIETQQANINRLVRYLLSASIFRHLCGIALLHEYRYRHSSPMSREMYFLRDIGFIQPCAHRGFLDFTEAIDGTNLVDFVEPTPIGWSCVALRANEVPADWLQSELRTNLRVDQARSLGLQLA